MNQWQRKNKTTPPQETQQELPLPNNNEQTDDVTEEQVRRQIGLMLQQTNCMAQFALSLLPDARYSLVTPVTEEALSFALLAMGSHIMSTCDQLKASMTTSNLSQMTTENKEHALRAIEGIEELTENMLEDVFGEAD